MRNLFLKRYQLAKEAGFKAVESAFPLDTTLDQVLEAKNKSGVEQILLNVYTDKDHAGYAAIPGQEQDFRSSITKTIEWAKALGVKKVHIMSGKLKPDEEVTTSHDTVFENNLRYAVPLLEKANIMALIEPINKHSVPNYYLNNYDKAIQMVKRINSPNLRIMLDIFHLQQIRGNVTRGIRELRDYIGHVQIAQVPDRHEPNTSGELNYKYILECLRDETNYKDWIGLEYQPMSDVKTGLKWITEYGYKL